MLPFIFLFFINKRLGEKEMKKYNLIKVFLTILLLSTSLSSQAQWYEWSSICKMYDEDGTINYDKCIDIDSIVKGNILKGEGGIKYSGKTERVYPGSGVWSKTEIYVNKYSDKFKHLCGKNIVVDFNDLAKGVPAGYYLLKNCF
jgi:hypothetical protein